MGLTMYTAGVVSIVLGCLQVLNIIFHNHEGMLSIVIIIACIVVGIIGVLNGITYMDKK